MKHCQIVFRNLLPTDQNPAESVHPAMGSLDNPPACFESSPARDGLDFLTASADVRRVSELPHQVPDLLVVIPFIQAKPLRGLPGRSGTSHWNALQGWLHQPHVVPIRALNCQSNGNPGSLTQQTSLDAVFGSVRRIWSGFFPRPTAPSSSRHPSTARPNQCPSTRHTRSARSPRVAQRPRLYATVETADGPWNCCISRSRSTRSTDSRCARRTLCRSWPAGREPGGGLQPKDLAPGVWATTARSVPTPHRVAATTETACSIFSFSSPVFMGCSMSQKNTEAGCFRIGSKHWKQTPISTVAPSTIHYHAQIRQRLLQLLYGKKQKPCSILDEFYVMSIFLFREA